MSDAPTVAATPPKPRLPWFVHLSPEFYDDACDNGFGWEGWAKDEEDAIKQALENCHTLNDREPYQREEDMDVDRAEVHVAEIDFRRFAGPLLHWAGTMGGWDTPLWRALEAAVREAGLKVAPIAETELEPFAT